jgi:hypothetical protein
MWRLIFVTAAKRAYEWPNKTFTQTFFNLVCFADIDHGSIYIQINAALQVTSLDFSNFRLSRNKQ